MQSIYLSVVEHESDVLVPVLATVVRTKGSAPQKPGSSALFGDRYLITGTIGGGVVEGRIQSVVNDRIHTGKSGYYQFNLANDITNKEEAICGGRTGILVDASLGRSMPVFRQIKQSIENNDPGVLITIVSGYAGNEVDVQRFWTNEHSTPGLPPRLLEKIRPGVKQLLLSPSAGYLEIDISEGDNTSFAYLEPVLPPLKLVIAGAGHIGRALSKLGSMLGFEVTVIDDRAEYANRDNIPEANHFLVRDVAEAVGAIRKTNDTYVVIVTRGHKDDTAALRACIGSDLAYIGMIGSRRKIEAVRREFIEKGWAGSSEWEKIYSPVGIDINSQTVEEIAVSIAAQIILVKNSKKEKQTACPA